MLLEIVSDGHAFRLPFIVLAVFLLSLALLVVEILRVVRPRYSYWQALRWVFGSSAFAVFFSWWAWGRLGKTHGDTCSPITFDNFVLLALMVLQVVLPVLVLVFVLRNGNRRTGDDAGPDRTQRYPPLQLGIVFLIVVFLGGAVWSEKWTWALAWIIVSFPVVVMIPSALAVSWLDVLTSGKAGKKAAPFTGMPGIIAGAVLPAVALALLVGLWWTGRVLAPFYVADLNARFVPPWNHPELLRKITGRIYWAGPSNAREPLRCFDPGANVWREVPNAPPPNEYLHTVNYWDVQGNLFAHIPFNKREETSTESPAETASPGESREDSKETEDSLGPFPMPERPRRDPRRPWFPPSWWRQVRVVSLADGRQVASIDISNLPGEEVRQILRIRLSPDLSKLAVLFSREIRQASKKPEERPWLYGLAIYELPTGNLLRVLDRLRPQSGVLCWFGDSARVLLNIVREPSPSAHGARPRRSYVLVAADIRTGQATKLLPGFCYTAVLCPRTGRIIAQTLEGWEELAMLTPMSRGKYAPSETIPCSPGFRLKGISPDGCLLIGDALVPTLRSNCGARTALLIVDTASPDTCHLLGGEPDTTNRFWNTVIWRDGKE